MAKNLYVFDASAGSGKTFQLTKHYISLLFTHEDAYKHILAVTFTNKATDEMKSRILSELHKLANNLKSPYLEELKQQFKLDEQNIREKANRLLQIILHDYSHFMVSTIDRFFQKIIRSFMREIGIYNTYRIELDNEYVLESAVNNLMMNLHEQRYNELKQWLLYHTKQNIENGKSWDIKKDIISLGKEILKEQYLLFDPKTIASFSNTNLLSSLRKNIVEEKNNVLKDLQSDIDKVKKLIADANLSEADFKANTIPSLYKKKLEKFLSDRLSDTFLKLSEDSSNYYTLKTDKNTKQKIDNLVNNGLGELINKIIEKHIDRQKRYFTAISINKNNTLLGVVENIRHAIQDWNNESNSMLLSDSGQLLRSIIDGSDTPFIYEKVGTYIQHYMLDEFQDTSKLQWENFKPLIGNSLSNGNFNLIVGDAKQSIYRWRNSDLSVLTQSIYEDYGEHIEKINLATNRRSESNIIDFNNIFFQHLVNTNSENEFLRYCYSNIKQETPKKEEKGYINIQLFEETSNEEENKKDFYLTEMVKSIEKLQENGHIAKDIAILVRTNTEAKEITEFMLHYKNSEKANKQYLYDVVSDDGLLLANAQSVRFIITCLKFMVNPNDKINTLHLAVLYNNLISETKDKLSTYLAHVDDEGALFSILSQTQAEAMNKLLYEPLYSMVEQIISVFNLIENTNEYAFIQTFQDAVLQYITSYGSDLPSFLLWWNDNEEKYTIAGSDQQNAIRILTIHKSKGLEFECVIVPFCDWNIRSSHLQGKLLWININEAPYNALPILPISYPTSSKETFLFDKDIEHEQNLEEIDAINLLYVAFTRAKKNLFIFSTAKKSTVGEYIASFLVQQKNENKQENIYEKGKIEKIVPPDIKENQSTIKREKELTDTKDKIQLQLRSRHFYKDKDAVEFGNLMHSMMDKIQSKNDVPKLLNNLLMEGLINIEDKDKIEDILMKFFNHQTVSEWYNNNYKVYTERTIITKQGKYRPDKILVNDKKAIVIDYKFGEEHHTAHEKQIKQYMLLLQEMTYTDIQGYVYYAQTNTLKNYHLE